MNKPHYKQIKAASFCSNLATLVLHLAGSIFFAQIYAKKLQMQLKLYYMN
jgi:hypothetical protein